MARGLTAKQRKFIEVYSGNGVQAARDAGYTGNENTLAQTAHHLLRTPKVAEAIRARQDRDISRSVAKKVANREERQAFWSSLMNDESADPHVRLRASELLGKSEADFTEKVQSSGEQSLTIEVVTLKGE